MFPFFSTRLKDFVLDSVCICGHLQSEHGSRTTKCDDRLVRESGHGNCCQDACTCPRFTWERDVTSDEAADRVIALRTVG